MKSYFLIDSVGNISPTTYSLTILEDTLTEWKSTAASRNYKKGDEIFVYSKEDGEQPVIYRNFTLNHVEEAFWFEEKEGSKDSIFMISLNYKKHSDTVFAVHEYKRGESKHPSFFSYYNGGSRPVGEFKGNLNNVKHLLTPQQTNVYVDNVNYIDSIIRFFWKKRQQHVQNSITNLQNILDKVHQKNYDLLNLIELNKNSFFNKFNDNFMSFNDAQGGILRVSLFRNSGSFSKELTLGFKESTNNPDNPKEEKLFFLQEEDSMFDSYEYGVYSLEKVAALNGLFSATENLTNLFVGEKTFFIEKSILQNNLLFEGLLRIVRNELFNLITNELILLKEELCMLEGGFRYSAIDLNFLSK